MCIRDSIYMLTHVLLCTSRGKGARREACRRQHMRQHEKNEKNESFGAQITKMSQFSKIKTSPALPPYYSLKSTGICSTSHLSMILEARRRQHMRQHEKNPPTWLCQESGRVSKISNCAFNLSRGAPRETYRRHSRFFIYRRVLI